ncbi:MAG: transglutaminase domain-containing protein [Patescibacteria group bacterium]
MKQWRFVSGWLSFFLLMVGGLFTSPVYSAESDKNFVTDLNSTYTVTNQGLVNVEHNFTITNQTPTTYVKQYAIRLQQTGLENIKALSQGNSLTPNITTAEDQTNIALAFPDAVVGEGKQRKFSISYTSPQIALITGQVLEVRIPQLADATHYRQRQITLITPLRFGLPYRVDPTPDTTQTDNQTITQTFSSLEQTGVMAIFGQEQIYNLTLRYFLDNPSGSPVTTQIALPPTTAYQELQYQSLEPRPTKVHQDADGNWLAEYLLRPHEQVLVNAVALVRLTLDANPTVPQVPPLTEHTQAREFWPVDHPEITALSSSVKTVAELYQLVIEKLDYTDQNLTQDIVRVGAVTALSQPTQAVCQEFADLFITLVRSKGIPARRVAGFAYTDDERFRPSSLAGDVLHAWAQFFNTTTNTWQSVDPTWEDTTGGIDYFSQFDLNHIAFAFNGLSSSLPYPAGFYKQSDSPTQDVVVTLADSFPDVDPNFKLEIKPNSIFGFNLPGLYKLNITNQSGQAWYWPKIEIKATGSVRVNPEDFSWPQILPFETKELDIFATSPGWKLTPTDFNLSLQLGPDGTSVNLEPETQIVALPAIFKSWSQFVIILSLVSGFTIVTLGVGSLLVLRQKKFRALRGQSQKSQEPNQLLQKPGPTLKQN